MEVRDVAMFAVTRLNSTRPNKMITKAISLPSMDLGARSPYLMKSNQNDYQSPKPALNGP